MEPDNVEYSPIGNGNYVEARSVKKSMISLNSEFSKPNHLPNIDNINSPAHYASGSVECIEALESLGIAKDFCRGNAIKYLWRCESKGSTVEDLKKAQWYLARLIQLIEKEQKKD